MPGHEDSATEAVKLRNLSQHNFIPQQAIFAVLSYVQCRECRWPTDRQLYAGTTWPHTECNVWIYTTLGTPSINFRFCNRYCHRHKYFSNNYKKWKRLETITRGWPLSVCLHHPWYSERLQGKFSSAMSYCSMTMAHRARLPKIIIICRGHSILLITPYNVGMYEGPISTQTVLLA